jgi:vancomycin resistance protein YoaR
MIAFLIVGGAYARDEVIDADRVSRGVTIVGIDVSRNTAGETSAVIAAHEDDLLATPVVIIVDGQEHVIDPSEVELAVDEGALTHEALTLRREDGVWPNIKAWLNSWTSNETVEVPVAIDDDLLAEILDGLTESIGKPAYDGAISVVHGKVTPDYPHDGLQVDVVAAVPLVREQLLRVDRLTVDIPLAPIPSTIDIDEMDRAIAEADGLVSEPVILTDKESGSTILFSTAGLKAALRYQIVVNSQPRLEVSLDEKVLTEIASGVADRFTIPPESASYVYDKETKIFTVVPSVLSSVVDLDAIPATIGDAIATDGSGKVPRTDGPDAEFSTEVARAVPMREVSSFTTSHPCCQRRVTNIQNLADEIDGSVVLPGETFSVNDTAGKRTLAEGYVRAGAIINGEVTCCDHPANIGGGTSQFATTFYNAIFFGCYEDVFHQPHSLYFSRYPYVREATMGFPAPDVKFLNDSDAAVYIDTSYTSGSITVTFYGDNGGRACSSERSGNTITRVMEHPDGSTTRQQWTWTYKQPKKSE